jgi:hypothetical protein
MVDDDVQPIPGMIVSHVEDVDDEMQALMSLLLQIVDGQSFRRYGVCYEKEKIKNIKFSLT